MAAGVSPNPGILKRPGMDQLNAVASAFRVHLLDLADWLCGCRHRQTTFPMTLRTTLNVEGKRSTKSETYIVCLTCGRHFAYDWTAMRMTRKPPAWVRMRPGLGRHFDQNELAAGDLLLAQAARTFFDRAADANSGSR